MVTVPTFSNLPDVANARPEVTPQKDIDRFQRADFEAVGEGEQALGRGIDQAGADASRIGAQMAVQQNSIDQKNAAAAHQNTVNNLGYVSMGTAPDGSALPAYYSLKGQAAVDARPAYLAAIQASQVANGKGLSQDAQAGYNAQTQSDMVRENQRALDYGMVQQQTAATQAGVARIGAATTTAMNNPSELDNSLTTIHSEAVEEAKRVGQPIGGDWQNQYEQAHRSPMLKDVITKQLESGNVQGASTLFEKYGPMMLPADNVEASARLKGPLLQLHAQQDGDHLIGPQASSGNPAIPSNLDQPTIDRSKQAYDGLVQRGMDPSTALGFAANFVQESGSNPATRPGDMGAAHGIAMWRDDRLAGFKAANGGKSPEETPLGTQLDYVMKEMGGSEAGMSASQIAAIQNAPADQKAAAVSRFFERPQQTENEMSLRQGHASALAKAWGMDQFAGPGAPPGTTTSAAAVAAEKPPRPDFEGAIGAVPFNPQDPERQQATIAYIRQRANQYDVGEATERDHMEKTVVPNTISALENGAVNTTVPELAIRRAYGADAQPILDKINDAKAFGTLANQNKFASPEDINTQVAALRARISPDNTDAADVSQAVKGLAMLSAVTKRNDEALKADPWSYVRAEPSVAAAYAGDMSNPANVARAVAQSQAVQTRMGATPQAISTSAIEQNVAKIHQAQPEAVPGIMSNLRQQYGAAWPDVFRDLTGPKGKLNPEYATLATMPQGGAAPVDYAAALEAKYGEKGKDFGAAMKATPSAEASLEGQIATSMKPLRDSFSGSSGDGRVEGYTNSVRTLATFYADRGMEPTQAVKNATSAIFGNLDIQGQIRAPTTLNGQPFSAQKVLDAGNAKTADLHDADLVGTTAAQARGGRWVTNPDGQGVTLQVQNKGTGTWQIVRTAGGADVTMPYNDLYRSVTPAEPLPPGVMQ